VGHPTHDTLEGPIRLSAEQRNPGCWDNVETSIALIGRLGRGSERFYSSIGLFSSVIILYNKDGTSMSNGVVAQIRTPTEDELKRMRDLWSALKQKPLPASTETGIELQTYLAHAARIVGIIAGLHPVTGEPVIASKSP
jgi:hypothetical protein